MYFIGIMHVPIIWMWYDAIFNTLLIYQDAVWSAAAISVQKTVSMTKISYIQPNTGIWIMIKDQPVTVISEWIIGMCIIATDQAR